MTIRYLIYIVLVALPLVFASTTSTAQPILPDASTPDTTRIDTSVGTTVPTAIGDDSLRVSAGAADTVVNYSARDSMKLSVSRKLMKLYGDAEVTKGDVRLNAGYIEIDFRKSELFARAVY